MKFFALFFLGLSLNANAHELFCNYPGGPGGSSYPNNVDTIEQDLRNGARAIATRRIGNNAFDYELSIVASGRKLASTKTSVPLRLSTGSSSGIILKLNTVVHGDAISCQFRF